LTGLFITFEGVECAGKSTVSRMVAERLRKNGYNVILTSEPAGGRLGMDIRKYVLSKDVTVEGEALLFNVSRYFHVKDVILPALEEGKVVLCDRFCDSTFVYQGIVGGLGVDRLVEMHEEFIGIWPDLTFVFDVDVETAMCRLLERKKVDRFEKRGRIFLERVRNAYLDLVNKFDFRKMIIVDSTKAVEDVAGDVFKAVIKKFKG